MRVLTISEICWVVIAVAVVLIWLTGIDVLD